MSTDLQARDLIRISACAFANANRLSRGLNGLQLFMPGRIETSRRVYFILMLCNFMHLDSTLGQSLPPEFYDFYLIASSKFKNSFVHTTWQTWQPERSFEL